MNESGFLGLSRQPPRRHRHRGQRHGWRWLLLAAAIVGGAFWYGGGWR